MKNKQLKIIAGPCSVDQDNIKEIYEISDMENNGRKAIWGTRVIGLKSRTAFTPSLEGLGMDAATILNNTDKLLNGGNIHDFDTTPSVKIAKQIAQDTNLLVASEIMMPTIQVPIFEREMKEHKMLLWNPSVNQLGWQILQTSKLAKKYKWHIGIKNGKWIGSPQKKVTNSQNTEQSPIEKTWEGLSKYSLVPQKKTIMIHRGFETGEKGDFRAKPIHQIAKNIKINTGRQIFFDPSHSYGPKLRDRIVKGTINAMQLKINQNEYLYDGILIEVGNSKTDTEQHITLDELRELINKLSDFRELISERD